MEKLVKILLTGGLFMVAAGKALQQIDKVLENSKKSAEDISMSNIQKIVEEEVTSGVKIKSSPNSENF